MCRAIKQEVWAYIYHASEPKNWGLHPTIHVIITKLLLFQAHRNTHTKIEEQGAGGHVESLASLSPTIKIS